MNETKQFFQQKAKAEVSGYERMLKCNNIFDCQNNLLACISGIEKSDIPFKNKVVQMIGLKCVMDYLATVEVKN